jgi:sugar phosphate isomerase/epimerase
MPVGRLSRRRVRDINGRMAALEPATARRSDVPTSRKNWFTVFTKPWPELGMAQLGDLVKGLGFDGIELPVRPGFPVTPETVRRGLPEAARILADHGVKIGSVAGPIDEPTIAACGECGVPIIRVMAPIALAIGYRESELAIRRQYDAALPLLQKHGVAIGVQNHSDAWIGSAIGIMHLIEGYDPRFVGVVLDTAHSALAGEPDGMAIDIAWSHLLLVNLKSAYWQRTAGPEVLDAPWRSIWTTGGLGITNWRTVAAELKRREYRGDICLTAEYSGVEEKDGDLRGDDVIPLLTRDLRYARSLFAY